MDIKDILLITLPILSAIIGSYLTYFLTNKSKQQEAIIRFKEEKYTNLIISLQGFLGKTASTEIQRKFFEEKYKSWLYSSDDVIRSVNNLVDFFVKQPSINIDSTTDELIGKIILSMRKDLLHQTKLKSKDFRYNDIVEKKQMHTGTNMLATEQCGEFPKAGNH